jgi:poly-gamma-glutamate synthesis protein (capsule biosynthesis protein)
MKTVTKQSGQAWKSWVFPALAGVLLALGFVALRQWPWPPAAPPIEPPPPVIVEEPPVPITLTFVGDIMLDGGVGKAAKRHGTPYLFAGVQEHLTTDDLTVGNLECAVSTRGKAEQKTYTFRADPAVLPGLRESGIEAVTLGNNHAMDFGRQALLDTLRHLREAQITAVGAGANADEAYRPALLAAGEEQVALFGISRVLPSTHWYAGDDQPGLASAYNPTRLLEEIRAIRPSADLIVVYFHWGVERAVKPQQYQRLLAQQCIDAGADLIIGSHPHVLQGFEYYRGKLIVYSLGNFVFNSRTGSTMMIQTVFLDGVLQTATAIPCGYNGYRPQVMTQPASKRSMFAYLQTHSFGVSIREDGVLVDITTRQPAGNTSTMQN